MWKKIYEIDKKVSTDKFELSIKTMNIFSEDDNISINASLIYKGGEDIEVWHQSSLSRVTIKDNDGEYVYKEHFDSELLKSIIKNNSVTNFSYNPVTEEFKKLKNGSYVAEAEVEFYIDESMKNKINLKVELPFKVE